MNEHNFIITIGREFGCGGRKIGTAIAEKFGIKYYDKELLIEAAKNTGVSKEFFEEADERSPSFFDSIFSYNLGFMGSPLLGQSTPVSAENIYAAQSEVIKEISKRDSCVIVGRSADYVLRNHPCLINIFIHAPKQDRINRIMAREGCNSQEEALQLAEKKDKIRAGYYNFYTDKRWGEASSYDLTIDSSKLNIDEIVNLIYDYAQYRINSCYKNK